MIPSVSIVLQFRPRHQPSDLQTLCRLTLPSKQTYVSHDNLGPPIQTGVLPGVTGLSFLGEPIGVEGPGSHMVTHDRILVFLPNLRIGRRVLGYTGHLTHYAFASVCRYKGPIEPVSLRSA